MGVASGSAEEAYLAQDAEFLAVFNGTLDNQAHLVAGLYSPGAVPDGLTPAHVLITAFRRYGVETPSLFRGLFSGAITDGRTVQ
jgi:hypothetical protein